MKRPYWNLVATVAILAFCYDNTAFAAAARMTGTASSHLHSPTSGLYQGAALSGLLTLLCLFIGFFGGRRRETLAPARNLSDLAESRDLPESTNTTAGNGSEPQNGQSSQSSPTEQRLLSLFNNAHEGFFYLNTNGIISEANPSFLRLLDYETLESLKSDTGDFLRLRFANEDQHADLMQPLQTVGSIEDFETQLRRRDGSTLWVDLYLKAVYDNDHQILYYEGGAFDVTRRKVAEERLLRHVYHDKTTGLPDRNLFLDKLSQFVRRAQRQDDYQFAVIFIDVDRFKTVNSNLGHMVGDQLLSGVARKIEACLRSGDTLARTGGDEFAVLLDEVSDITEATQLADRILKRLALPTSINGQEIYTTASMGIALGGGKEDRTEDLLREADIAVARAKDKGRACYEVYDAANQARARNSVQLEADLRRAVERNEFRVNYQPIVSLATGRLIGFEALIRWTHQKRGPISPGQFIPIAEDTGLIVTIGQWVLRESLNQLAAWQRMTRGKSQPLMMSVNLSARQFAQADLVKTIERRLQAAGLDGSSLKLEVTESAIMNNPDAARNTLMQLKGLGIKLSLDDFGTGYSSLSYLHRFPFNVLKIDQSFVSQMDTSDKNEELVRTIVAMAHALRMDVIAEGVETEAQLEHLKALRCHYGQGYFFAGAMDSQSAGELISANPQW